MLKYFSFSTHFKNIVRCWYLPILSECYAYMNMNHDVFGRKVPRPNPSTIGCTVCLWHTNGLFFQYQFNYVSVTKKIFTCDLCVGPTLVFYVTTHILF